MNKPEAKKDHIEKDPPEDAASRKGFFENISLQDKIDFARHLAMVVKAGLPVNEGLVIIKEQTTSKLLGRIIDQLMKDISNGMFLADSLERHQELFGNFFVNIVRVGESSGTLAQNLLYLADELKKSKSLQSKVKSAMVYPIVILVATIGVTGFLTFFVFPKLLPVLSGLKVNLPASTRALIATLNFLQAYGIVLLVAVLAAIFAANYFIKRIPSLRRASHKTMFYLPAVGDLVVTVNMVNFTRVLGLLLKSGVNIVEALHITSNTFENMIYKETLAAAEEQIRKGGALGEYLTSQRGYYPPIVAGMVRVGESTGNLEENLTYLSEYFEDEVDNKLHGMTSLLEPVLLLGMGLLVGFVAISIITPIYSISQGVK